MMVLLARMCRLVGEQGTADEAGIGRLATHNVKLTIGTDCEFLETSE